MFRSAHKAVVVAIGVALVVAGCSSSSGGSSPSSNTGTTAAAGKTTPIKIGILWDETGQAASGQTHLLDGIKAALPAATKAGYAITYDVADTQSSPQGTAAAAQKLVQQDHVDAVIAHSALTYAGAQFLQQHKVPVIGPAEDGPEWIFYKNMFPVYGAVHTNLVSTTTVNALKKLGVTNLGSVGYSISPSSAEAAKGNAAAATAAGMKVGYLNSQFPFGSTNVQPIAIAMKNAGVNGLAPELDPNSSFALVTALRNLDVPLKGVILPIGYGGDLLQAGPGTLNQAQNIYFGLSYEPIEMNTPATQAFAAALKSTGGTAAPGLPTYDGYVSMLMLIQGLQAAGPNPTQASLLKGLATLHHFTAGGLYGNQFLNVTNRTAPDGGLGDCEYFTKLVGDKFQTVPGLDPICGTFLPGKTVTP